MSGLRATLLAKFVFTIVLAVPLLFFPAAAARRLGIPEPKPILWVHLYGAAFVALLVGYGLGLKRTLRGQDVTDTVWVGMVSNGLACGLLLVFRREWETWGGSTAQVCLWGATAATFSIMAGPLVFGLTPALVRRRPTRPRSHTADPCG
jgi:hypothetical protein